MTRTVKANISWALPQAGGRQRPPIGPRYSTVARFEDNKDNWLKEAWTMVVEFSQASDESLRVIADVRFLVEYAPAHLLYPGSRFELFEGTRLVARGEVLG